MISAAYGFVLRILVINCCFLKVWPESAERPGNCLGAAETTVQREVGRDLHRQRPATATGGSRLRDSFASLWRVDRPGQARDRQSPRAPEAAQQQEAQDHVGGRFDCARSLSVVRYILPRFLCWKLQRLHDWPAETAETGARSDRWST